ncbi:hypothetical protein [Dietzia sp. 179-F 9C3 NHS]|uniref:hypothetical protein n=1 Tax=Dietzia sp. 179-F 9C3 NHS TaxID=3374295 RepID=UPI0038795BB5
MPTHTDAGRLPVWVRSVTATPALRQACADFQLTSRALLLVSATHHPDAVLTAAAHYGVPQPAGSVQGMTQAYAASLCDFARQYPDHLLARPGTGLPVTVTDPSTGATIVPWADLGPLQLNDR